MANTADVFFKTKEGFEGHMQIEASDPGELVQFYNALVATIIEDGATARDNKPSFNKAPSTEAPFFDPMEKAAGAVFGAEVSAECPSGCGGMRRVKGTNETGRLSKAGKPYPSFYACNTCGHKQNA